MMSAEMPLIGALVLAIALTASFFRAFWRMDLSARGRRQRVRTPRRQVLACAVSAMLPLLGALVPLLMADRPWEVSDAPILAATCAVIGWLLHGLMDGLMLWGTPRTSR